MLKALGVAQACLKVNLSEDILFMRPSPDAESIPSDDPIIRGTLVMTLPKMRRIKSLSVRLVAQYNISFPDYAYEASQKVIAEVALQESKEERLYEKGEHMFSFVLVVPSSCAPFERCSYGRIVHTIVACAQSDGVMGTNLEVTAPVYLIANPAPVGETADLNMRTEGFREELGPYAMATAAQHLTVGGLLNFDFLLAQATSELKIISISATLFAHYTMRSIQRPNSPPQYATKKTRLFIIDANNPPCSDDTQILVKSPSGQVTPPHTTSALPGPHSYGCRGCSDQMCHGRTSKDKEKYCGPQKSTLPPDTPLQHIEAGGSYQLSHLARLPNDDIIRPSTLQGTKTPIETRHELALEVRFIPASTDGAPAKPLVLRSEHSIILSSCCCMLSSLLVPAYSEVLAANPGPVQRGDEPSWPTGTQYSGGCTVSACVCESSKAELIAQYRAADERLRETNGQHGGHNWNQSDTSGGGRTTVVVSWDNLEGAKHEYVPAPAASCNRTEAAADGPAQG